MFKISKKKGTNAERELIHQFWSNNWTAVRIAGSGSSRYPCPDILAASPVKRIAIEAKVTSKNKKYFSDDDINQINLFSSKFGAEAWLAVKFKNKGWFFIAPENIGKTKKGYVSSLELAKSKGIRIENFLNFK